MIADILAAVQTHQSVLIDGEVGLGLEAVRDAVADAAIADGWRVIAPGELVRAQSGARLLLIGDLADLGSAEAGAFIALRSRSSVPFVLSRRPAQSFEGSAPLDRRIGAAGAVRFTLEPLTPEECDLLVDEQVNRGDVPRDVSPVERRWIWTTSGGFPRIAAALLHDLIRADDAPPGPIALSRGTVLEATTIVNAQPPLLRTLGVALLPLIGVGVARLRRSFDAVELSLLFESNAVTQVDEVLRIPMPLQAAWRLQGDTHRLQDPAREVLVDICTAVSVDAGCSEGEVFAAVNALAIDHELRVVVGEDTHFAVLSAGMWAARRRGDNALAAALARRIVTAFPARACELTRIAARGEDDDLAEYTRELRDGELSMTPSQLWTWVLSLRTVMTGDRSGVVGFLSEVREHLPATRADSVDELSRAAQAADALEAGDWEEAAALADALVGDESAAVTARYRALAVGAAVAAVRLDHDALHRVDRMFVTVRRQHTLSGQLSDDFATRTQASVAMYIALAFVGSGLARSAEALDYENTMITRAMVAGDGPLLLPSLITRMLSSMETADARELQAIVRFLRRNAGSELGRGIVAIIDSPRPGGERRRGMSRFVRYGIGSVRALTIGLRSSTADFGSALRAIGEPATPLVQLGLAFVNAATGTGPIAPDRGSTALESHTVPGALRDYLLGRERSDPETLMSAASVLLAAGAAQATEAALNAVLSAADDDEDLARRVRSMRRVAGSRVPDRSRAQQALTQRERQVALLAAQGMRNGDIARRLYLSIRTVESHLYRAKRKLLIPRESLQLSMLLREPERRQADRIGDLRDSQIRRIREADTTDEASDSGEAV